MSTFSTKPPSKSVFVGNIPYGLTEEQIIDIFSSAGKVLNFRLVYDRETGRPKGFGFAEYPDSDSASSAVRNLNDYEIMNRKLRVDFSNDGAEDTDGNPINNPQLNTFTQLPALINGVPVPPPGYMAPQVAQTQDVVLPPLPQGVDPPEGLTCTNAISRTLGTLPPQQLLEVLSQMKSLVSNDPATATALLKQAPQLSYAIFQALLLMNLVSTDTLTEVVDHAPAPPPAAAPGPAPAGLPIHAPPPQQYQQPPYGPPQGYPPAPPAGTQSGYAPPPPQAGYGAPPPQAAAPPTAAAGGQDMDVLVQQVLAMPQELIDSLAPAERAQIMALRAQFGGAR